MWWPGRFAPQEDDRVTVLASYGFPDKDFWLADLTLQSIPSKVFSHWRDLYGVNLSADFLEGLLIDLVMTRFFPKTEIVRLKTIFGMNLVLLTLLVLLDGFFGTCVLDIDFMVN